MLERNQILTPAPDKFFWAVGIEDTFIPQAKPGLRALDEYELTQHYDLWREDLQRAAALGVEMIRWGVPWYRVEVSPGVFDWTWTDQVIAYMQEVKLEPIIDLVHYGTPLWMEESFSDPRYPEHVARFTREFVKRYRHQIRCYTPLNEPTVNSDFSGRRSLWPPYLNGDAGYVSVMLQIASGMQASIAAIRAEQSDAVIFAVEAMNYHRACDEASVPIVEKRYAHDLLAFDLVTGRVDENHLLYPWLLEQGASPETLKQLRSHAAAFDVFGLNFYPWSSSTVRVTSDGRTEVESGPDDGRLIVEVCRKLRTHTDLPIFVTETSAANHRRAEWMTEIFDAIRLARLDNIPVIGLTWFPLVTMIAWDYRTSETPIEEHLLDLGLVEARFQNGTLVRQNSPDFDTFHSLQLRMLPELRSAPRLERTGFWHRLWYRLRRIFV